MYDVMVSGMGARPEPLIIIITTAGFDFENKPCYAEYEDCCNILDDTITNDEYFVLICELDKEDNPKDERVWRKANPILCSYEEGFNYMKRECKRAFDSSDDQKKLNFLTKNCNIWVNGGKNKYLNIDFWKACKRKISFEDFRGRDCFVGMDLSKTGDLTSCDFEFPFLDNDIRMYALFSQSFIPAARIKEHEKTDKCNYEFWTDKGWLIPTEANEGLIIDFWTVLNYIEDMKNKYDLNVIQIGYDPHGASMLVTELENRGFECVEIPQSARALNEPTVNFRDLISVQQIIHDGNKLLTWSAGNCETDKNSFGEIKISKKSRFQRIDPVASGIFSHKLAMEYWNGNYKTEITADEYKDILSMFK